MSDNRTLTQGEMEWITSRLAGYRRDAWSHSTIENYVRDVERLVQHIAVLQKQRDEAQEAADTYHQAWQDAAAYWKESRDQARGLAHSAILRLKFWTQGKEEPWLQEMRKDYP